MNCQRCGKDNPPEFSYCQACGSPMMSSQVPQPPPAYGGNAVQQPGYPPQQPIPGYPPTVGFGPTNYANIGVRFLAALIDGVIIGIPIGIITTALSAMMAVRVIHRTGRDTSFNPGMAAEAVGTFFAGFGFIMIISLLLSWAYFALMESSSWQGTVGKKIMGIQVADLNGARISLGRATLRLAVKAFLSGWFLIGYIMAFFTQKKQTLHDLIAGTLVLSAQAYPWETPTGYTPQQYPPQYPPQYPSQYPPQPPVYSQPPQYSQQPQAPTCPNCGGELQPNARYCSQCGQNLS